VFVDLDIPALAAGRLGAPAHPHFPRRRSPFAACAALSAALAVALLSPPARGVPPDDPEALPLGRLDRSDEIDRVDRIDRLADPRLDAPGRSPLWIALDAALRHDDGGSTSFGALLLLGLPLDRLSMPRRDGIAEGPTATPLPATPPPAADPAPASSLKPPARGKIDPPTPPATAPKLPPAPPGSAPPRLAIPVAVTAIVARAAVDAALRKARLVDPEARADAMASRARTASALPELRLRAARIVDDGQSLSPTAYDPSRIIATGGTSVRLEARATWRLDRLVFADEEVALEHLRQRRIEARARLVERVLGQLFAWQRARALEEDPGASPEEHLAASLRVLEAEAELDLLTGGWFTEWAAKNAGSSSGAEKPVPDSR
jgi:hypothetical protein